MEEILKDHRIDSDEGFNNIEITSVFQLSNLLKKYNVPVDEWKFGSVFSLFREVLLRDCQIVTVGDQLYRLSDVALIDIYTDDGKHYLRETVHEEYDNQDNLIDRYSHDFQRSISETKKTHETFQQAVTRGIWEELNIPEISSLSKIDEFELEQPIESYPGLGNILRFKKYSVEIPNQYYNPTGYTNYEPTYGYTKIQLEWDDSRNNINR